MPIQAHARCGTVEQTITRMRNCGNYSLKKPVSNMLLTILGIDHPQGPGRLISYDCDVLFYILLPVDRNLCPYAIFLSIGTHLHCPPPPNRAPQALLHDVLDVIRRMEDPRMTLGNKAVTKMFETCF